MKGYLCAVTKRLPNLRVLLAGPGAEKHIYLENFRREEILKEIFEKKIVQNYFVEDFENSL